MVNLDSKIAQEFAPLGGRINALLVWPKIPASFWSFEGMMKIVPEKSVMPPLGLITVAALCPKGWTLRLVDEAIEKLTNEDILWADLVMVSAMQVQSEGVKEVLSQARRLGRRTIIGGPYASSQPEAVLDLADHVVVGEPDEVFDQIANDLETGHARRLYEIIDKPSTTNTPIPRFDLLKTDLYSYMAIQFSRGCPFQCEFCDIITIYGRKPRTKTPRQVLTELDALLEMGWHKDVFIVDDNFIGNSKQAMLLLEELKGWQQERRFPFAFSTEASMDLAQKPELIEAMVAANFFFVFVGIESPSKEALTETKKLQNLRQDPLEAIRFINRKGLWVAGGFIVGFDSDTEDIFDQQRDFIEAAAIPWAMAGFLKAPPTTALHARLLKEGRLITVEHSVNVFSPPNFRTVIPKTVLLEGGRSLLTSIYDPEVFYERAYRSLKNWKVSASRKAPNRSVLEKAGIVLRSIWFQGINSPYRSAYWKFFFRLLARWSNSPVKLWLGFTILLSGHHFLLYMHTVVEQIDRDIAEIERQSQVETADLVTSSSIR